MIDTSVHAYEPSRRDRLFLVLAGVFVTHALLGELTGGKLIVMSVV